MSLFTRQARRGSPAPSVPINFPVFHGSVALSGQAAGLKYGRKLVAETGAFTLSGQAATVTRQRVVVAATGAFTHTGQSANLLRNRKLVAAVRNFTLSGQAANLLYGRKFTAGHWASMQLGSDTQTNFDQMFDAATFKGVLQRFTWGEIETSEGVYDWSVLISRLNYCHSLGKKYAVQINDRSFNTDANDGANPLPTYLAHKAIYYAGSNTTGYTAIRWDSEVVTRYRAMLTDLHASISGLPSYASFELFAMQETALGFSALQLNGGARTIASATNANPAVFTLLIPSGETTHGLTTNMTVTLSGLNGGWASLNGTTQRVATFTGPTPAVPPNTVTFTGVSGVGRGSLTGGTATVPDPNYSPQIYANYYIDMFTWAADLFVGRRAAWFFNQIPQNGNGSHITTVINGIKNLRFVDCGGPDCWPTSTGLNNNTYPYYETHKDDVPLFIGMSVPTYDEPMTIQQIYEFARDTLNVNKIYWIRTSSSGIPADARTVVNNNQVFNSEPSWGSP